MKASLDTSGFTKLIQKVAESNLDYKSKQVIIRMLNQNIFKRESIQKSGEKWTNTEDDLVKHLLDGRFLYEVSNQEISDIAKKLSRTPKAVKLRLHYLAYT